MKAVFIVLDECVPAAVHPSPFDVLSAKTLQVWVETHVHFTGAHLGLDVLTDKTYRHITTRGGIKSSDSLPVG